MPECIDPKRVEHTEQQVVAMSKSHDWIFVNAEDYATGLLERGHCPKCGADRVCIISSTT